MSSYYLVVTDKETYDRIFNRNQKKLEACNRKTIFTADKRYEYYSISWRLVNTCESILKKYYDAAGWVYMAHEDLVGE